MESPDGFLPPTLPPVNPSSSQNHFDIVWQPSPRNGKFSLCPFVVTIDPNARLAHWKSLLTAEERQALTPEAVKAAQSRDLVSSDVAHELAIEGSFERSSVVSQRRLEAEVLRRPSVAAAGPSPY
jgi:hypothetical protein